MQGITRSSEYLNADKRSHISPHDFSSYVFRDFILISTFFFSEFLYNSIYWKTQLCLSRMLLQRGSLLLKTVAFSSTRNLPSSWNCVLSITGRTFSFSSTRNFAKSFHSSISRDFSVKFNEHGHKLAIFTNCVRYRYTRSKVDSGWRDRLWYSIAVALFMTGATILSVPLYRVFCQVALN